MGTRARNDCVYDAMYVLFPHVALSLIWAGLPRRLSRFTMPCVVGACLGGLCLLDARGWDSNNERTRDLQPIPWNCTLVRCLPVV